MPDSPQVQIRPARGRELEDRYQDVLLMALWF
jgi:hypothetical protein